MITASCKLHMCSQYENRTTVRWSSSGLVHIVTSEKDPRLSALIMDELFPGSAHELLHT